RTAPRLRLPQPEPFTAPVAFGRTAPGVLASRRCMASFHTVRSRWGRVLLHRLDQLQHVPDDLLHGDVGAFRMTPGDRVADRGVIGDARGAPDDAVREPDRAPQRGRDDVPELRVE